jgi:hypothetical protein
LPCNQIAIDDNNVRVLLTSNILRPRLYQSHLWQPRRILGHSEVGHFGRRESSHTFPGKRPRPIIGSRAEQRRYSAAESPNNLPVLAACLGDHPPNNGVAAQILEDNRNRREQKSHRTARD